MTRPTTTASNLFRRSLCPGSARLEAGLPEEDSEQAREGRLLHYYYAHPEYERSVLSHAQRDLLDRADEYTEQAIQICTRETDHCGSFKDYRETNLDMLGTRFPISGRPDYLRFYLPGVATIVVEQKFGFKPVESSDLNLQTRVYSVQAYDFSPSKVTYVVISQPRLFESLTIAKYTPEDIEDSRQQIISILEASAKPDAPLNPSETACRYCKAKMICEAYQSKMMITLPLTPEKTLSKAAKIAYLEQKLSEQSNEKLSQILQAISFGKMLNDPANDEARRRGDTDYWTIGKETEVREVTDVRKAIALLSLAGLEKQEIFDCVNKLSLTDLGETVRKKHPTWDWKQVRDWINEKLKSVIETETKKARVLRK